MAAPWCSSEKVKGHASKLVKVGGQLDALVDQALSKKVVNSMRWLQVQVGYLRVWIKFASGIAAV